MHELLAIFFLIAMALLVFFALRKDSGKQLVFSWLGMFVLLVCMGITFQGHPAFDKAQQCYEHSPLYKIGK